MIYSGRSRRQIFRRPLFSGGEQEGTTMSDQSKTRNPEQREVVAFVQSLKSDIVE